MARRMYKWFTLSRHTCTKIINAKLHLFIGDWFISSSQMLHTPVYMFNLKSDTRLLINFTTELISAFISTLFLSSITQSLSLVAASFLFSEKAYFHRWKPVQELSSHSLSINLITEKHCHSYSNSPLPVSTRTGLKVMYCAPVPFAFPAPLSPFFGRPRLFFCCVSPSSSSSSLLITWISSSSSFLFGLPLFYQSEGITCTKHVFPYHASLLALNTSYLRGHLLRGSGLVPHSWPSLKYGTTVCGRL